jgi:hypothetical protein
MQKRKNVLKKFAIFEKSTKIFLSDKESLNLELDKIKFKKEVLSK